LGHVDLARVSVKIDEHSRTERLSKMGHNLVPIPRQDPWAGRTDVLGHRDDCHCLA
jgi:hypothetical protein